MKSNETYRRYLLRRLRELGVRLTEIEKELVSHDNKDWEDLAVEREEDEVLESLGEAGLEEVRMIRAALKRFDEGTYGKCVSCGEAISEDRLDVLPATPFCRHCATERAA
jgi:RNA polymerase-binding transcription factor DksA